MRFETTPEEPEALSDGALANRRLIGGILVSLLLHALILSLQFCIPGLDLPSLEAPWKERRTAIEPLQVEIASPAPQALPVKPIPSVTTPELFKLPTPVLPAPIPKASVPLPKGIQLMAPIAKVEPVAIKKNTKPVKAKIPSSTPPQIKRVLPPAESPTRIIAQDQVKNDDFVVPLTSEEELQRRAEDKKENKQKSEAIPEDAIIDKNADAELLVEQKRQDELKKLEQEKLLAEQKHEADLQQKKMAQEAKEKLRQQEEQLAQQVAQQKAMQEKMAQEKLAQESLQRERERAIEEMLRETKRQELLTQETLKQEEQRRQAEQKRLRQLAQEQELQKQEALAQAQLRQKQQEEQAERKRALEIAERKKAEELEAQKLAAQIEQKRQEQVLAEQKVLEQKLAEQRANEQKIAQQKLADQKLAEQKLAEQKLAEQKAIVEATSRANAEREAAAASAANAANAARLAAAKGSSDSTGQGKGGTNNAAGNAKLPSGLAKGDLASRLREQARSGDMFKSAPGTLSSGKLPDDNRARRRSFLGAYDKEVPLRMYVDSLKQKMERNGNLIYEKRSLSDVEHNVLINMVIRSDGTIEEVTIMRTSGNRAIDEKARNIIMANAPFSVFPPTLAAKYDVIEIQRVWSFGDRLRILEDLPPSF